jgi:hypothetical protein
MTSALATIILLRQWVATTALVKVTDPTAPDQEDQHHQAHRARVIREFRRRGADPLAAMVR